MRILWSIFLLYFVFIVSITSNEVSFSVVGDIMNHDLQIRTAYRSDCNCWDYRFCFQKVKPYLESSDITIGNLETTLPGDPRLFSGYPKFGAPDALLDALVWSGFDILTLANNHSVDKGLKGMIRTHFIVKEKGLIPLGTFRTYQKFREEPVIFFQKKSITFAFLNFTYGTNGLPVPYPAFVNQIHFRELRRQIRIAKEKRVDVIILLLHYGKEYITEPNLYQKYIVQIALKEGVDIILGGHPHVLQPYEFISLRDKYGIKKDRLIVWSLGNFVSNQKRINTDGGMIFQFKVKKQKDRIQIFDIDYIPVYVDLNRKHYILPIHEYLYLSYKKELGKKYFTSISYKNKTYFAYFYRNKEKQVVNKNKMLVFFRNAVQIVRNLPRRMQIQ